MFRQLLKQKLASQRPFSSPATTSNSQLAEPDQQLLLKSKVRPDLLRPFLEPVPILQEDVHYDFSKDASIERLFKARVHYGHKTGTLNENMKWAIYGERIGVCLFDLDITQKYLVKALNFLAALSYCGGRILFLTTNKNAIVLVEGKAAQLGQYAHTRVWNQGMMTNRQLAMGGPVRFPDAMVFLNTQTSSMERHPAIVEAAKMCIPTVGIVDSNCEPNYISFPIPGNDDSLCSLEFYMEMFAKAIQLGRNRK